MIMKWFIAFLLISSTLGAPGRFASQFEKEGNNDGGILVEHSHHPQLNKQNPITLEVSSEEDQSSEEFDNEAGLRQEEEESSNDFDDKTDSEEESLEKVDDGRDIEEDTSENDVSDEDRKDRPEIPKIIGGEPVADGEFPYQVSIQAIDMFGHSHFCGGVIMSQTSIVTAAQCVQSQDAKNLVVIAGIRELYVACEHAQQKDVQSIIVHPEYDANTNNNDIAILQLTSMLTFDDWVNSIGLAEGVVADATECTTIGWGSTAESGSYAAVLQKLSVTVVGDAECQQSYEGTANIVDSTMVCAGGEGGDIDFCQGDEGGPLACGGLLHGMASWGYGCARGYPGVYTEAIHYKSWIEENISL
uniref:Trypsin-1-like n=1 Tax=Hirondellea gigas TaxID=1518452 RepID=A0A6A7G5B2_9CRUS